MEPDEQQPKKPEAIRLDVLGLRPGAVIWVRRTHLSSAESHKTQGALVQTTYRNDPIHVAQDPDTIALEAGWLHHSL